jgi:hypothetical protein
MLLGDKISDDEMGGHVERVGEIRNSYKILVGKPEGKRPLRRRMRTWEDITKMDLTGRQWESVYWKHISQDRDQWRAVVNTVMNFQVT